MKLRYGFKTDDTPDRVHAGVSFINKLSGEGMFLAP